MRSLVIGHRGASAYRPEPPLVIGHRGASAYRPEHTLASYTLAAWLGADYLEPDLVATRDGVLVARHENEIGGTTDIAERPELADRRTTKTVDGSPVTGWFIEDLTLAELKTLRARERLPELRQHSTVYDGRFEVPTFEEILQLRRVLSDRLGREVGVYPETKHPTYFRSLGLPLEPGVVALLEAHGLNDEAAPAYVQSFEVMNLRELKGELGLRARTVLLTAAMGAPYDLAVAGDPTSYADLLTPQSLPTLRPFVDTIGPAKEQVIPWLSDGSLGETTALVDDAHAAGMQVMPYTFRAENVFLPAEYRSGGEPAHYGRGVEEMVAYLATGIDGLFTDNPDLGALAVAQHAAGG